MIRRLGVVVLFPVNCIAISVVGIAMIFYGIPACEALR